MIFTPSKQHFDFFNLLLSLLIKHPWESLFLILNCLRTWILNTKTAIWTWQDRFWRLQWCINIITDYHRQRLPSLPAWTSTWNKEISTENGNKYSDCHRDGKSTVESIAKRNPRLFNSEEILKNEMKCFSKQFEGLTTRILISLATEHLTIYKFFWLNILLSVLLMSEKSNLPLIIVKLTLHRIVIKFA